MLKAMCVILGLVFLAMGIMGIMGVTPMFDMVYVTIGQIVLGALALVVGIYARQGGDNAQGRENARLKKENNQQKNDRYDQLKKDNEQQRVVNDQQRKDNYDQLKKENDQQKMVNDQQRKENVQQRKSNG